MPAPPGASRDLADAVFRVGRAYGMTADRVIDQAMADRGELTTRTRLMFWVMPQATVADTLYTAAGGRLLREDRDVGILAPGAFADVVGFRADLLDCPVDDLPSQQPALTLVGGRPVHDPDGLLVSAGSA